MPKPYSPKSSVGHSSLELLAGRLDERSQLERWRKDPVMWVEEFLGEEVWSKQAEVMRAVAEHPHTVVRSAQGVGKSFVASRIIAWYLCCFPPGDYFCLVTAPRHDQIKAVIWRYLAQLHAEHDLPGFLGQDLTWRIGNQLVAIGRKPADHDQHGMQGIHARRGVIAIGDEGCGLPEQIFNALDAVTTTAASRTLVIGNPDITGGKFQRMATGAEPGWNSIKISAYDCPDFTGEASPSGATGLVDRAWVEDKAERWGRESALFKIKVEGEFADDHSRTVIPREWVLQAQARWADWHNRDDVRHGPREPAGALVFGVDVGHLGEDRTVIATVQGDVVERIESWRQLDTVAVTDLVATRLDASVQGIAVVDAIGVGAGVVDQLRQRRKNVRAFVASAATNARDNTGTQRFFNVRAQAWWRTRELLDPGNNPTLCLPIDDNLLNDLCEPRWEAVPGAKIKIESKDEIRKRLKRSTDCADAVIAAIWHSKPDGRSLADPWDLPEPLYPIPYRASRHLRSRGSKSVFEAPNGYRPGRWT